MKKFSLLPILLFGFCANAQIDYTQFVNPLIGTGGHGHTFPGATLPFAMVQLSPDTRIDGSWDGCSGYHYSDSVIYGFSHMHLSGTGCSDYGDIAFLPYSNGQQLEVGKLLETELSETFKHKNETVSAGYYSVVLDNNIKVELTSTARVGFQKYTYKSENVYIILNLNHRDKLLDARIKRISDTVFNGYRRSEAWAKDQLVFYHFELSRKPNTMQWSKDSSKLILYYYTRGGNGEVSIKTALSSVNESGAKANMDNELNHWDFEKVKLDANKTWNKELNKIKVFGGTKDENINFYTALYHCMIHPNIMNDANGQYMGRDKKIHRAEGFNYYTVFSLWDTYRALHPLLNIIDKKRSRDFIKTFRAQFEQSGRLPMWELWGNETNCMIGFHSVSVILDSYNKGVISKDELKSIYPAVKAEAMSNRFGLDKFREKGFLSVEDESESVSKTLEYSYDMSCVAQIADLLQQPDDYEYFKKLAGSWRNVYDVNSGFMRPRKNGGWLTPFDPKQVNNHYTEANSWQYSFAVPHEYREVKNSYKVSEIFNTDSKTTGREQSDISGMIGQYAHGNEPSHHIPYLFNNTDSASKYVKKICSDLYKPTHDGLCGNEDCGQMSAWYVFSAMGFYQVNPSTSKFYYGHMIFDSIYLSENLFWIYKNMDFAIKHQRYKNYIEIHKHELEAKATGFEISKTDLHQTGEIKPLVFGISFPGNENLITVNADQTGTTDIKKFYYPSPIIMASQTVFKDSIAVEIKSNFKKENSTAFFNNSKILYKIDNGPYRIYDHSPFYIRKNAKITAYESIDINGFDSSKRSENYTFTCDTSIAYFYKKPNTYTIKINSTCDKQYTADGDDGLIDGLLGETDWRKGKWQGYQGKDFEAVVDLKTKKEIKIIKVGFLQDMPSWILFPKSVAFYGSNNNFKYKEIATLKNSIPDSVTMIERKDFTRALISKKYRYIKIKAINYGQLPEWHQGAGGEAYIFIDEITIE